MLYATPPDPMLTVSPMQDPNNQDTQPHPLTLGKILKRRPELLCEGQNVLGKYIERNTTYTIQKAMALNIFSVAVSEGHGILSACEMAGKCTSFTPRVIRQWAQAVYRDFFAETSNIDDITDDRLESELSSNRGKHPKWISLMHDEDFRLEATQYVRENGYVKGAPNLTLAEFARWVAEKWDTQVCEETARLWLHDMGFTYRQFSKGVYFDGHERDDVTQHRKTYLHTLASLDSRMITSPSQLVQTPSSVLPPIIRIFHDESTFHANADQSYHWSDGSNNALKQKSLGQAVMVSDFIDEVNGYLEFEGEEARLYLEHQSEEYFTNDLFVDQVMKALDIFEEKYPGVVGLWIFDNAPSHLKKPEDCLNPDKMNVSDGGKQPFLRESGMGQLRG